MTAFDRWIDRYLKRLAFGRFLHQAAEWLAIFLFVFGTLVLIAKLAFPSLWPNVLWLGVAAIPVAVVAWLASRREWHTRGESAALLDSKLGAGGLLMTLSELPDEQWSQQLPQYEHVWNDSLPKVRPIRMARYLAMPLIFVVGAGFVPLRKETSDRILLNSVGRQTSEQLEEALKLLDEAKVVKEEEKKELKELVERLKEETEKSPLTHEKWETVDKLREKMQLRLESATLTMEKGQEAAGLLEKAGLDLQGLSLEQTAHLEKNLLESLKNLSPEAFSKMSAQSRENLQRLLKEGKMNPSQNAKERQQMLKELSEMLKKESDKLKECRGKCKQCLGGQCQNGQCQGNKSGPDVENGKPGRGGVNRGRGDAELTYGDDADKKNTRFQDVVLPPGMLDKPKEEVIATTPQEPEVDPAASAPRNAERTSDPSSGKETWNRKLRPRHRSVVRGYFDSERKE